MFCANRPGRRYMEGFSLVEVMVGMAVGLLSMLVILKMLTLFENQKRTTIAGSNAQVNGLVTLVSLEQGIRTAGSGFAGSPAFDCTTIYAWNDTGGALAFSFFPLRITDGGSTGSDSIAIQTANNFLGVIPATITSPMPSSSSELNVSRTTGFAANDLILVSDGGNCTLMQLTAIQSASMKLQHNPGGSPTYNPSVPYQTANGWPAYGSGALILGIGQLNTSTFSVDANNNLQVSTSTQLGSAATSVELATDIVSLQAQYGIAPAGSQNVNAWVSATGATWAAPSAADIKRIKAVRLIVVARSGRKEASNVTLPCTNAGSGVANNGPCSLDSAADPAPAIDLSANPDWQRYRYRVSQTVIPLRNVIWANL